MSCTDSSSDRNNALLACEGNASAPILTLSYGAYRDEHGFVSIKDTDGIELARDNGFQHNVNFHDREEKVEELIAEVLKKSKGKSVAITTAGTVVISSKPAAAAL